MVWFHDVYCHEWSLIWKVKRTVNLIEKRKACVVGANIDRSESCAVVLLVYAYKLSELWFGLHCSDVYNLILSWECTSQCTNFTLPKLIILHTTFLLGVEMSVGQIPALYLSFSLSLLSPLSFLLSMKLCVVGGGKLPSPLSPPHWMNPYVLSILARITTQWLNSMQC